MSFLLRKVSNMEQKGISLDDVIIQRKGLDFTHIDDEIVMMDISKGKYYGFNGVGSRIWELVAKPLIVNEVISILLKEFDVDDKICQDTVLTFLNKLYDEDLISIS